MGSLVETYKDIENQMFIAETKTDVSPIPSHPLIKYQSKAIINSPNSNWQRFNFIFELCFVKIFAMVLVLQRGTVSILRIIKGQNYVNNVRGVNVFVSEYCLSLMLYICIVFHRNIFHSIKVLKRTHTHSKYHKIAYIGK